MAAWTIRSKDDTLLDPCFGTSTLLTKGVERLLELGATLKNVARQTFGVEISKKTIDVATSNLVTRFGRFSPKLIHGDFLTVEPESVSLLTALICNPPYKRHQEMSTQYKQRIKKKLGSQFDIDISMTSDMYVYFMLHATRFLKEGGRMAFLTPTQYLENSFGSSLRRFLAENMRIHALILFDGKLKVFPNSMSTASLLLAEKSKPDERSLSRIIRVKDIPSSAELLGMVVGKTNTAQSNIQQIRQIQLLEQEKWTISNDKVDDSRFSHMIEFGDIFDIHRGIATGANCLFVFTDEQRLEKGLEREYLKPIIAKSHYVSQLNFTMEDWKRLRKNGKKVWLLDCRSPKGKLKGKQVHKYLKSAEKSGLTNSYILNHRSTWYAQEKRKPPPILFTYMSNGNPRFILNEARLIPLNTLHCIYPRRDETFDAMHLKAMLAFLNSSFVLHRLHHFGRMYGKGLLKLEPREMKRIPVIDLEVIGIANVSKLAGLFDRLATAARKDGVTAVRQTIDDFLFSTVFTSHSESPVR